MAYTLDLGPAPAREQHAQLGETVGFATINAFEVRVFRIAIIASFGPPPRGCLLYSRTNETASGTYRTLALRVLDETDRKVATYAKAIAAGIATWAEAAMPQPVDYRHAVPVIPVLDEVKLILNTLHATKVEDTAEDRHSEHARIHANLTAAYPEIARIARETGS